MERLGVRRGDGRDQPDPRGQRGQERRDQGRVEPALHAVGAALRSGEVVAGLQTERVLDGEQVEQPALGGARQVDPVAGAEQLTGPGTGLTPGRGVPAGTVERHREVQR